MFFKLKKKKVFFILCLIIVFGIFLRTYHFSDWLKFNSDQARDASVVRAMIEEDKIPLLGPVAGGSPFKIGPAFYYFQFAGAKIFGTVPDKMAYPDLLWGILTIPLIYFFLKEFFKKPISLVLTGLYAVSYFAVEYSRFAWNPNSTQFFCLLLVFSIIKILNATEKNKISWIILAGLSLGIAIQLHALLLFGMILFSLVAAVYLIRKKVLKFSGILIIFLIVVFLNLPQIINEVRSKGGNYAQFRQTLIFKSEKQSPLWKNTFHIVSCQIYSNVNILIPRENQEDCADPFTDKYFKRLEKKMKNNSAWILYFANFFIVCVFSFGGYLLLFRRFKKEEDEKKKNFIRVVALFNLTLLAVFIPYGAEISLRYFIFLAFMPFILLGLWMEIIIEKPLFIKKFILSAALSALIVINVSFNFKIFRAHVNNFSGNMIDGTMNQAKEMAEYIIFESDLHKKIQIGGQNIFLGRFINRISYFMADSKIEIISLDKGIKIDENLPIFAVGNEMSEKCHSGMVYEKYGEVEKCRRFYDVTIMKIKNNSK